MYLYKDLYKNVYSNKYLLAVSPNMKQPMLVSYCCVTYYSELKWLKRTFIILSFCGSRIWEQFTWVVLILDFPWSYSQAIKRLWSSEVWTEIGRFASNMAHLHGCWWERVISHHMGFSIELLQFPHIMAIDFPQNGWSKRGQGSPKSLCDLVSKDACHHFHFILFIRNGSLSLAHNRKEREIRLHFLKGVVS